MREHGLIVHWPGTIAFSAAMSFLGLGSVLFVLGIAEYDDVQHVEPISSSSCAMNRIFLLCATGEDSRTYAILLEGTGLHSCCAENNKPY